MSPVTAKVDFYILEAGSSEQFACRLVEKAYDQGHRVYVRASDSQQARRLDELLWTFRQGSFLPHALIDEAGSEPIVIGSGTAQPRERDVLVNLAPDLPPGWDSFNRVAEVVADEAQLAAARERFRHYRSAGLQPDYHKVNTGT